MGKTKIKAKKKDNPAKSIPVGEVLTLAEAAAFLRVAEASLLEDVRAGGVPAQSVGGEWRFGRSALLQWLRCEEPSPSTRNERLLATIGCLADDATLEPLVEEIYRARKAAPVGAAL